MRTAILLAAGLSTRFGRKSKLLAPLAGRPLLAHAILAAQRSVRRVIVVTGARAAHSRRIARRLGAETVHAPLYRDGLSASLAAGVRRLRPIDREVLLLLGDMPAVPDSRRWRLGADDAVRPIVGATPGHPVLVRASLLRAAAPSGDRGLGPLLGRRRVRHVRGTAGAVLDLDTPRTLRRARIAWRRMS